MDLDKNAQYYRRANMCLVGGVNSPVRAFGAVGEKPIAITKSQGAYMFDANGKQYIDFISAWGANILGHCDPLITEAISKAAAEGACFGLSSYNELELTEMVKQAFPSIELLRLVNSGTEAVMSAIRVARSYTGKKGVIKFEGCYHGHSDFMLAKAGSGLSTFSIASSSGVPQEALADTHIAQYNCIESVERIVADSTDIACIILEPIAGNMGVVPPQPYFLEKLRKIADKSGFLLIFDEVMTGFRVSLGGAQELYGIKPDITILGKIIGGGMPIGAFGGRKEIMECLSPKGKAYQAGTFSGNPVVAAAGIAALKQLFKNPPYRRLEQLGQKLEQIIAEKAKTSKTPLSINRIGSMFTVFHTDTCPTTYNDVIQCDTELYADFFKKSLKAGILLPPSQFETSFLTCKHTESMLEGF